MKKLSRTHRILFCGVGGQGVLCAAEVVGVAAMLAGYHVKKSELRGMAQRGGSVESHVVFGDQVFSPLIIPGHADFLVSLHADEGARLRHFLKERGVDLWSALPVAAQLPDKRFANTYLLGALSALLPIAKEHWMTALQQVLRKSMDENLIAFALGAKRGKLLAALA